MSVTRPPWSVGVVIPANDEESTIGRCIASVLHACRMSPRCTTHWVAVVADACTDRTVEYARSALGAAGEVIECDLKSAGSARRRGALAVLRHWRSIRAREIWLANTDADTYVPGDWVDTHLRYADEGASGVAGIVRLEPQGLSAELRELYRTTYQVDNDGAHAHIHGANLGVRADAYLDAGGWPHLALAEDHCLWRRLLERGWKLRSAAASVVTTSARLQGRALGGFADTLRRELARAE